MAGPHHDRLLDALWPLSGGRPEGEVYALLDGARDPRIYSLLSRSLADSCCLYLGELSRERAEVAPYLVALSRHSRVASRLIEDGWGNSWGVFLSSTAILQDLRRHFRRFLQVKDESGRRMLFRFYDPRVMRAFLPACNAEELRSFFGPVESFHVEGVTPDSLIEFRRSGSGLSSHRVDLAGVPGVWAGGPGERETIPGDRSP